MYDDGDDHSNQRRDDTRDDQGLEMMRTTHLMSRYVSICFIFSLY